MLEFERRNIYDEFIKVRDSFEELLLQYNYLIPQIVTRYRRSASRSFESIKSFYMLLMQKLKKSKQIDQLVDEIIQMDSFHYLVKQVPRNPVANSDDFSRDVKSELFIKEALSSALKCKICNGYIHVNSISMDHIRLPT